MQSLYGKSRLVTKLSINSLKNVELRKVAAFESRFSGGPISRSSGFHSRISSPGTAFFLNKNIGTQIVPQASSEGFGMSTVLPTRSFATLGSSTENVASSSDVPPRIKFKRLDKTARHIMQIIDKEAVEEVKTSREIPEIKPGYIIQLKVEVPENKRRVSIIKGIVIAMRNAGLNTTFRIRRLVGGVGIENLFPLYSPNIKEVKVLEKKKVRRAKLYYLRDKMNALKKH